MAHPDHCINPGDCVSKPVLFYLPSIRTELISNAITSSYCRILSDEKRKLLHFFQSTLCYWMKEKISIIFLSKILLIGLLHIIFLRRIVMVHSNKRITAFKLH